MRWEEEEGKGVAYCGHEGEKRGYVLSSQLGSERCRW